MEALQADELKKKAYSSRVIGLPVPIYSSTVDTSLNVQKVRQDRFIYLPEMERASGKPPHLYSSYCCIYHLYLSIEKV